jgi:LmbE family N-acetylglucosaminyl deacetylase
MLVLAPHPDDETLSCGATISRVSASGGSAVIMVATDGRFGITSAPPAAVASLRREEVQNAAGILGVDRNHLVLLELPDGSLDVNENRLSEVMKGVLTDFEPDVVVSPAPFDVHPDHAVLGRVARSVLRDQHILHLEYLVLGWHAASRVAARIIRERQRQIPRRPVRVRSDGYLDVKGRALACHRSQVAAGTHVGGVTLEGSGPVDEQYLKPFTRSSEMFFPAPRA